MYRFCKELCLVYLVYNPTLVKLDTLIAARKESNVPQTYPHSRRWTNTPRNRMGFKAASIVHGCLSCHGWIHTFSVTWSGFLVGPQIIFEDLWFTWLSINGHLEFSFRARSLIYALHLHHYLILRMHFCRACYFQNQHVWIDTMLQNIR